MRSDRAPTAFGVILVASALLALGCGDGAMQSGVDVGSPGEDAGDVERADAGGADAGPPSPCGNGVLDPGEVCDDGDNAGGNRCSATCTASLQPELEFNDWGDGQPYEGPTAGEIASSTDVDVYSVVVPEGGAVGVALVDDRGGCALDAELRLYDGVQEYPIADGSHLWSPGACQAIVPQSPIHDGARNLAAGTYYVVVSGYLDMGAYELTIDVLAPACGNAVEEPGEACDDGDQDPSDWCDPTCAHHTSASIPAPGGTATLVIAPGDSALIAATTTYAGQALRVTASVPDGDCPPDLGLMLMFFDRERNAGIGWRPDEAAAPFCAEIDPSSAASARELAPGVHDIWVSNWSITAATVRVDVEVIDPGCGNGVPERGEQCDDGDGHDGDGCSAACTLELAHEVEPNDTVATASVLEATISGTLGSPSDVDLYAVTVPAGGRFAIVTSNGDGPCMVDARIRVIDASGAPVMTPEGRWSGACPWIWPTQLPALAEGAYFVEVSAQRPSGVGPYVLSLEVLAPSCGDGFVDPGEQCDDGSSGPRCTPECKHRVLGALAAPGGTVTATIAAHSRSLISLEITRPGQSISVQTSDASGVCASGMDVGLELYAPDGHFLGDGEVDYLLTHCRVIFFNREYFAQELAVGTYALFVESRMRKSATVRVAVDIVDPGCGNSVVDGLEQCDDGNASSEDICDASCVLQFEPEYEPNDTLDTATYVELVQSWERGGVLDTSSDVDLWAVEVPPGGALFAQAGGGHNTCVTPVVVRLLDGAGVELTRDEEAHFRSCARVDPFVQDGAKELAGGLHYVEVTGLRGAIGRYTLWVEATPAGCGNGLVERGETCDGEGSAYGLCSEACELDTLGDLAPPGGSATTTLDAYGVAVLRVTTTAPSQSLRVTTGEATGACPEGANTLIELYDEGAYRQLGVVGFDPSEAPCAALEPTRSTFATNLRPDVYWLFVWNWTNEPQAVRVDVEVIDAACGNGILEGDEQCDDGNTTPGDGCGPSCAL